MKLRRYYGIGTSLMLLASFAALAEQAYAPAEYKPKVEYTEQRVVATPKKDSLPAVAANPTQTARSAIVENTLKTDHAADAKTGAIEPSLAAGSALNQGSSKSSSNILLAVLLAAGGLFIFMRKKPAKQAPISAQDTATATGVERYIEKMTPQKTGVAKYLEKHSESTPVTGVAKYMAKQAVKNRA